MSINIAQLLTHSDIFLRNFVKDLLDLNVSISFKYIKNWEQQCSCPSILQIFQFYLGQEASFLIVFLRRNNQYQLTLYKKDKEYWVEKTSNWFEIFSYECLNPNDRKFYYSFLAKIKQYLHEEIH